MDRSSGISPSRAVSSVRRVLAALEDRLYRDIPTPDLVFHLTAPLDVTLARNAARAKNGARRNTCDFRHAIAADLLFDGYDRASDRHRHASSATSWTRSSTPSTRRPRMREAGAWRGSG